MNMNIKKLLLLCISALCFSTMIAKTSSQKVETDIPTSWNNLDTLFVQQDIDQKWWIGFGDATLNSLVDICIANNYDLAEAAYRVDAAKAAMRKAEGGYYPSINLTAAYDFNQNVTAPGETRMGTVGADLSWEIDIIGAVRGRAKSQKYNFQATQEEYNAVMTSLIAKVVSSYINLRTAQSRLDVVKSNLYIQEQTKNITEARFNTGLASALDVAQAKSIYYATAAKVPELETTVSECLNAIGILSGKIPWMLDAELNISTFTGIPASSTQMIPVSVPAEILRQRPDVRAAEKSIDAAASLVGATVADWLPKFYVTGKIGVASEDFKNIFQQDKMYWQVAPAIKWNIFSGTALSGQIQEAKAKTEMAVNAYNNVVLNALQEVDNSMVAYKHSISEKDAYAVAHEQAQLTFDLALDLYKKGLIEFQNVLDAQRNLLNYEEAKVLSEANVSLSLVHLYLALGGGY
jgi:NodT family efflux transporter outer membrane factor (OMF) lipoprotein